MDNSRRSFDRSRQTGAKKPRLADQPTTPADRNSNGRKFPQRPVAVAAGASVSSSRLSERSEPVNEPYEPQELQVPQQELVSQYRTALAELTVNSKPIITNLTIIAGENSHAAKGIAATICKNIIEVPRDQKLPSLYLLDSIVKNLGKDYIKHFAPKLPEVFCKTYKQVDPSIHSGMRHLFGTWKGVFPPRTLQIIEKELGFATAVNGSSSGTASARPDSQAQRPASIHVNPKYLEARQHFQQTTRAKGACNNISGTLIESPEDADRPSRTASVSSGRPRADPPIKNIRNVGREQLNNPVRDKKIGTPYGDSEYSFDLSRRQGLGEGRATEKLNEQDFDKSWYDSGSSVTGTMSNQRNGLNVKHGYQNYISRKPTSLDALVHPKSDIANRNSSEMSRSWKNTEEEEYMWDDMSSRSTGYGTINSSAKDQWMPDDSERLDFEIRFRKPQSTQDLGSRADNEASPDSLSPEQRDEAAFGHRMQSLWSQEPHLSDHRRRTGSNKRSSPSSESYPTSFSTLSTMPNPRGRNSFQSQPEPVNIENLDFNSSTNATLGSARPVGNQRHALGATSPTAHSPIYQQPGFTEHDQSQIDRRTDFRTSQFSGQPRVGLHDQFSQDSLPMLTQNVHLSSAQSLQASSSARPSLQMRHHHSIQQKQTEPLEPQIPGFGDLPTTRSPSESESSDPSHMQLLPHIMGSGKSPTTLKSLSDISSPHRVESPRQSTASSLLLAAVMKSDFLGTVQEIGKSSSQAGGQPPIQSGPRGRYASSGASVTPASVPSPTLPRGSSPSSLVGNASTQSSNAMKSISNPMSSLLSSLVSKGLITASKTEPQISSASKKPSYAAPNSSFKVSSVTPSFSSNENNIVKPALSNSDSLPQSTTAEIKNLIGLEFRANVLRELHTDVIDDLLNDLPHRCSVCGLQFKLKDRLDRHLEWHELKSLEHNSVNKLSRRWYASSISLVEEIASDLPTGSLEGSQDTSEDDKQMVPADESQFVCILCGELFEDFYSQESDQWMFKEAVYLNNESGSPTNLASQGPIVHSTCSLNCSRF